MKFKMKDNLMKKPEKQDIKEEKKPEEKKLEEKKQDNELLKEKVRTGSATEDPASPIPAPGEPEPGGARNGEQYPREQRAEAAETAAQDFAEDFVNSGVPVRGSERPDDERWGVRKDSEVCGSNPRSAYHSQRHLLRRGWSQEHLRHRPKVEGCRQSRSPGRVTHARPRAPQEVTTDSGAKARRLTSRPGGSAPGLEEE